MDTNKARAGITVRGLVQGVGFRYFVFRHALKLGLNGYVKNLFSGDVYTEAEGDRDSIERLYHLIERGPEYAEVTGCEIRWMENKDEFTTFDIRHS